MKHSFLVLPLGLLLAAACGGKGENSSSGGAGSGGAGGDATSSSSASSSGSSSSGSGGAGGEGGGGPVMVDCALPTVLCVDDTPSATQEFPDIQSALDAAKPGDTVAVYDGHYAGAQIETSGGPGAPLTLAAAGADVIIDADGPTGDGIRLQNVNHIVVQGFTIKSVSDRCIAARGATPEVPMVNLIIRGNRCEGAGAEGFYLSEVSQSLIEGNTITGTGVSGSTRSHGIYLANAGSDGTTIRRNTISGAAPDESNGIHFNGDLSIGGDGIISGLVVEENIIFGNAQNGLNMDGVQDSTIRNNVIHSNGRNAIRAYAIDAAEGPKGLRIVNNTLLTPATGGWPLKLSEDLGGHVVYNNILHTENASTGSISLENPPSFFSANNAAVDRFSDDGEATTVSLAAWKAKGYDQGSLLATAAALFVNVGNADFHLKAGAPAIDAGLAKFQEVDAPARDADGVARPKGGGFDMGAYERAP